MTSVIQKNANELSEDKKCQSSYEVRFIVSKDGRVTDVKAITKQDSKLTEVAVHAIQNGPELDSPNVKRACCKFFDNIAVAFVVNDQLAIQSRKVRLLSADQ